MNNKQKYIVPLVHPFQNKYELNLLRLDILHPLVQGNKHYKLLYNLKKAKAENASTLITFGGAFSNHIHATAIAGKNEGLKTIGIIRGESAKNLNPTLQDAQNTGMQLVFADRANFKKFRNCDYDKEIIQDFLASENIYFDASIFILPEGGTNKLAIKGAKEILQNIDLDYDIVCLPVGTGGTMAGIISHLYNKKKVLGFSSLKGNFSQNDVQNLLKKIDNSKLNNWEINNDFHFGGYAKWKPNLIEFINQFYKTYNIQLCPIYTGKMMFGIFELLQKDYFEKTPKILAIHTGGLQGIRGFNKMNRDLLNVDI